MATTNGFAKGVPIIIDNEEIHTSSEFEVISPYSGRTCWKASSASKEDAVRAVESAQAAFASWSQTKPTARRDILLKTADILERDQENNAQFMRTEMGADEGASSGFVVPLGMRMLREIASRIPSVCGKVTSVEKEGQSAMILKEPMGVILGIVPWNAPYVFGIRSIGHALATGNTTVIKSSEQTPRCYLAIVKAFIEAGLPAGCLNLISTSRETSPEVVTAMIEHTYVRKVNFTGSAPVGRQLAKLCGWNLKPILMELGGKNSAIVCADANIEAAVGGVLGGAYLNSGQICMSTDRILVHSSVAPAFIGALQGALNASKNPFSTESNPLPPTIVSEVARARVEKLVKNAVDNGAKLLAGTGKADGSEGIRLAPVLLGDLNEGMEAWKEESFASVAGCKIVNSHEEAIQIANDTEYGLSAAIFTEDLRKGFAIAKKLQSGAVHINSMTVLDDPMLPHGGVKSSGWGRFNTEQGLEEFLVTKSVTWMD